MELWFLFGIVVTLIHLKLSLSLFFFFEKGGGGLCLKSSTCWCCSVESPFELEGGGGGERGERKGGRIVEFGILLCVPDTKTFSSLFPSHAQTL